MAATASFSKTDNANKLADPNNLQAAGHLIEKNPRFIKIDQIKVAAIASFSVTHENEQRNSRISYFGHACPK